MKTVILNFLKVRMFSHVETQQDKHSRGSRPRLRISRHGVAGFKREYFGGCGVGTARFCLRPRAWIPRQQIHGKEAEHRFDSARHQQYLLFSHRHGRDRRRKASGISCERHAFGLRPGSGTRLPHESLRSEHGGHYHRPDHEPRPEGRIADACVYADCRYGAPLHSRRLDPCPSGQQRSCVFMHAIPAAARAEKHRFLHSLLGGAYPEL